MNVSRTLARATAVVATASAAACLVALPAFANAGLGVGTEIDGATPTRQVIPALQLTQLNRNLDLNTRNVELPCEAVAVGDAATTRITRCAIYVNGALWANTTRALPGAFAATNTLSQTVPVGASVYGCVTASAVWTDSTISPSRSACTPSQIALA
jgi:hypothetical protein